MSNEQKLREALQAIANIDDTTNHSVDASAALDRIGQIARQALALPTADHLPDAGEMIETAAPVGERLTLSAEAVHAAFAKHFPKTRISQAWIGFAAEIAEAIAARAALSAGDAVDAQRYRWLRDNGVLGFSGAPSWRVSVIFDAMDACAQTLDSNIDAAMRKDKP